VRRSQKKLHALSFDGERASLLSSARSTSIINYRPLAVLQLWWATPCVDVCSVVRYLISRLGDPRRVRHEARPDIGWPIGAPVRVLRQVRHHGRFLIALASLPVDADAAAGRSCERRRRPPAPITRGRWRDPVPARSVDLVGFLVRAPNGKSWSRSLSTTRGAARRRRRATGIFIDHLRLWCRDRGEPPRRARVGPRALTRRAWPDGEALATLSHVASVAAVRSLGLRVSGKVAASQAALCAIKAAAASRSRVMHAKVEVPASTDAVLGIRHNPLALG
jgi:hypothetical protein